MINRPSRSSQPVCYSGFSFTGPKRVGSEPARCPSGLRASRRYQSWGVQMTARILDGTKIRDQVFADLSAEIQRLGAQGIRPGLAAVLVGENPASQLYVKSKIAGCEQLRLAM